MNSVDDIMVKTVVTVKPEEMLLQVQKVMLKHIISRLVVVGKDGKPIGIVTQKDVVLSNLLRPYQTSQKLCLRKK